VSVVAELGWVLVDGEGRRWMGSCFLSFVVFVWSSVSPSVVHTCHIIRFLPYTCVLAHSGVKPKATKHKLERNSGQQKEKVEVLLDFISIVR
jgi:hypothetical protein